MLIAKSRLDLSDTLRRPHLKLLRSLHRPHAPHAFMMAILLRYTGRILSLRMPRYRPSAKATEGQHGRRGKRRSVIHAYAFRDALFPHGFPTNRTDVLSARAWNPLGTAPYLGRTRPVNFGNATEPHFKLKFSEAIRNRERKNGQ